MCALCLYFGRSTKVWSTHAESINQKQAFFAELDQEYKSGHGKSCGSLIPTLLRTGEIVNFMRNSLLTGKERMASLGLPAFECMQTVYPNTGKAFKMPFDVDKLSFEEQRTLAGNAQHLHVMLAVNMFVFANIERRGSLERLTKPMPIQIDEEFLEISDGDD